MDHAWRRPASGSATIAALVALLVLPMFVYSNVGAYEFIDFDDGAYIYENRNVASGFTADNVWWALTDSHAANWHPLTWVSHMVDVEMFGLNAGRHHQVNLAFHLFNVGLLFLVLRNLTGTYWRSALVAALFAVHPLNVENVAWVAERKTLLSTLFGLLAVAAYAAFIRRRTPSRYALLSALFALSLMSKPMLVTLPLLLLMLDLWPLQRVEKLRLDAVRPLIVEKLPLLALSALSSVVTIVTQSKDAATATTSAFPLGERVLNAFISYVWYLWKTVIPTGLSVYYPHPSNTGSPVSRAAAVAALVGLMIVTTLAIRFIRRFPVAIVGWSWYLVALLPVIGIIQVGGQSRADRYAYVPLIGVFILVVWLAAALAQRFEVPKTARAFASFAVLAALCVLAGRQSAVWQNRGTLYAHAVNTDRENWLAWNNLGMVQFERGELEPALHSFTTAALLNPSMAIASFNSGSVLARQQRYAEAIPWYARSLEVDPRRVEAWANLGIAHQILRNEHAAASAYTRALALRPDDRWAMYGLASLACARGRTLECERLSAQLAAIDPDLAAPLAPASAAMR